MLKYLLMIMSCTGLLFGAVDAEFTMSKSVGTSTKMAIVDASDFNDKNKKDNIFKIFLSDLTLSGNFNPSSEYYNGSFEEISATQLAPIVLVYQLNEKGAGVDLKVKLQQTTTKEILFSKSYSLSNKAQYPFLIHRSIGDLNRAMGYGDIGWMNKFVIISKANASGQSQIFLADYTLTYNKIISSGGLNIFPKWATTQQDKFYVTNMNESVPTLYMIDINNGKKIPITKSEGMLICSDVSKSGDKILLTMAPSGQPDIYEYTLSSNNANRITDYSGIDVSSRYGTSDNEIVFVSNRSGNANIYKKNLTNSLITQATNYGSYNNTFDHYATKMVYSSKESKGQFNLYLQNGKSKPIPLTTSGDNQYPKILSNGTIVAFVKQVENKSKIGYININNFKSEFFDFNGKIQSLDW